LLLISQSRAALIQYGQLGVGIRLIPDASPAERISRTTEPNDARPPQDMSASNGKKQAHISQF
jgi:hypothetical protein